MESGGFNSTVELTPIRSQHNRKVVWGAAMESPLFGTLYDTNTGEGTDVLFEDSGFRLHLDPTSLDADGTFLGQQMRLEHSEYSFASTRGAWGGQFSNTSDSAGDPRLVAGTFGAEATSAGGSEGAFLGSFFGTKE